MNTNKDWYEWAPFYPEEKDKPDPGEQLYLGELKICKDGPGEGRFILPNYFGYSDYSGCALERSNLRVFMDEFGDKPGVFKYYGGHGTEGLALTQEALDDPEIKELLEGLENYPVISEEDWSAVEMELSDESWDNYGRQDFKAEMRDRLKSLGNIEVDDDLDDAAYDKLWWKACERGNGEPYIIETGGSVWFYIEKTLSDITDDELVRFAVNGIVPE